jgi:pyridoxal phosphate enzyme (YggS family)
MSIKDRLLQVQQTIPEHVTLVAVSKTMSNNAILEAYEAGQRHFGENKVQELVEKQAALPNDIKWHFIGHLQTNKVKFIVPFVDLIEGVDSLKLLKEINKQALKNKRIQRCLLQFFIADEETKFGLSLKEAAELLESIKKEPLQAVEICGVMGMATYTDNENQIREEFRRLKSIFDELKTGFFSDSAAFQIVSMGMSGDYLLAIAEGSNQVRIGSTIFGVRIYNT